MCANVATHVTLAQFLDRSEELHDARSRPVLDTIKSLDDSDERTVEYHRVPYDIETAAQKIFDADLALNFGKRLFLGV